MTTPSTACGALLLQDALRLRSRIQAAKAANAPSISIGLPLAVEIQRVMEQAGYALSASGPQANSCDFCQSLRLAEMSSCTGGFMGTEARCSAAGGRLIAEHWISGDKPPSWCPRDE